MIARALAAWDRFAFAPRSPVPLAAFRIAFGLLLLHYLALHAWFFELQFGPGGLLATSGAARALPAIRWSALLLLPGVPFTAWYALACAAALALTLGLATRIASVLTWVMLCSLLNPLEGGTNSADVLLRSVSFLVMIAGVCGHLNRAHALDARGTPATAIPAWTTRLIQLQVVLVYFFSGYAKAGSLDWTRGVAMHYVVSQQLWARLDASWASQHVLLIGALTFGSMLFELLIFPALVWPRATRLPVLAAGLAFHLLIGLTVRIILFTELMPILYLCFLEDEHYAALENWMNPRASSTP